MKINSTKRSVLKRIAKASRPSVAEISKSQELSLDDRIKVAYQKLYNDIFQPSQLKKLK